MMIRVICVAVLLLVPGIGVASALFPTCTGPDDLVDEYLPLTKVQPAYPHRALQKGKEGFVVVKFTVTAQGTTTDHEVVESFPPSVFDRAAVEAARQFTYEPRRVDGVPVASQNVSNVITFRITGDREAHHDAEAIDRVRNWMSNDRFDTAQKYVTTALKGRDGSNPMDSGALVLWSLQGAIYAAQGKQAEAIGAYEQSVLSCSPYCALERETEASIHLILGNLYSQAGRWTDSAASLKRAIRKGRATRVNADGEAIPEDLSARVVEAYARLGLASMRSGQWCEAEQSFQEAITGAESLGIEYPQAWSRALAITREHAAVQQNN